MTVTASNVVDESTCFSVLTETRPESGGLTPYQFQSQGETFLPTTSSLTLDGVSLQAHRVKFPTDS